MVWGLLLLLSGSPKVQLFAVVIAQLKVVHDRGVHKHSVYCNL